jgi:hypothetical protein
MTPDETVFEFDVEDELRYTDGFLENQNPGIALNVICSLTDDDPEELLVDEATRFIVFYRYWDIDEEQPVYEVWNVGEDETETRDAEWMHEHLMLANDGDGR